MRENIAAALTGLGLVGAFFSGIATIACAVNWMIGHHVPPIAIALSVFGTSVALIGIGVILLAERP